MLRTETRTPSIILDRLIAQTIADAWDGEQPRSRAVPVRSPSGLSRAVVRIGELAVTWRAGRGRRVPGTAGRPE